MASTSPTDAAAAHAALVAQHDPFQRRRVRFVRRIHGCLVWAVSA
jgi:hypothetical protein